MRDGLNARRNSCGEGSSFVRRRESIHREPAFSFRLVAIISATDAIVPSILGRDGRGGREREEGRKGGRTGACKGVACVTRVAEETRRKT